MEHDFSQEPLQAEDLMAEKTNLILQVGHFEDEERLPETVELGPHVEARVEHIESVDELEAFLDKREATLIIANESDRGLDAVVIAKSRLKGRPVLMICDAERPEILAEAIEHGLDGQVVRYDSWEKTWMVLAVMLRRWLRTSPAEPTDFVTTSEVTRRPALQAQAFWAFFDAAPVGIKILDTSNRILYCNPKLQKVLGYTEEELRVLEESDLIHQDEQPAAERSFQSLIRGEADFSEVIARHIRKSGEAFWTTLGRVGLRDDRGELRFVLETVVEMERADHQVQSDTGASPTRRAFLGELASGIAHDLRNILSLIALDTEIVRDAQPNNDALVTSLERIIEAAKRGNRIAERINQIGRNDSTVVSIELCRYMEEFGDVLRSMIPASVDLQVKCAPQPVEIDASPSQIDQIVLNLVRNAADAMPGSGEIILETLHETLDEEVVDARPSLEPGSYAVIRVTDDGQGMGEETRKRIFEPYFTTKTGGDGTGLGLVNVFRATLELDGGIIVESKEGEGSTFSVYLPLSRSADSGSSKTHQ